MLTEEIKEYLNRYVLKTKTFVQVIYSTMMQNTCRLLPRETCKHVRLQ